MSTEEYNALCSNPVADSDPAAPILYRPHLEDITETEDTYGEIASTRPTAERLKSKVEKDRYVDIAIVLRRRLTVDRRAQWVQLELQAPAITEAVTKVCGNSYFLNTKVSPIIIKKPYLVLFHYREGLREYAKHDDRTEEEKAQLKILIDFMAKEFQRVETEYNRLVSKGQVTFPLVWALFKPGEEVFVHDSHYVTCGVVHSLWGTGSDQGWQLGTRSWDYNGSHFGPVAGDHNLAPFEGICDITSLSVYPTRFHKNKDKENLRQTLIERGRRWKEIVNVTHCSYEGLAWTCPQEGDRRSIYELVPIHVSSRIISDYTTHIQANPHHATHFAWSAGKLTQRSGDDSDIEDDDDANVNTVNDSDQDTESHQHRFLMQKYDASHIMSDDQALLCPAKVRGFSLADKKWAFFLVDNATDIKWLENPMDRLEIDEGSKRIIGALVTSHEKRQNRINAQFQDVIPGKGLGLALLFAGAPGLGKTLTAEIVSEDRKRPLYAITSGELGTNTVEADNRMRKIFDRAKAWDAYLLLDEADVFLAERSRDDLARNGLVTVFLRLIEYYEGVIFLTTNRLTAFDPAFESRIQFKLFYDPLTSTQRAKIWKTLLPPRVSLTNPSEKLEWDEATLESLGENHKINGREIKNMIKAGVALADAEDEPLTEKHLNIVKEINDKWAAKASSQP